MTLTETLVLVQAATTKYHQLGGLNKRYGEFKITMPAKVVPGDIPFSPGL